MYTLQFLGLFATSLLLFTPSTHAAAQDVISKWLEEFRPSVLSIDQQRAELEWFQRVAAERGLQGVTVQSTAESITIHSYESDTLAAAFSDITGIKVNHVIMDEGNLVSTITEQIRTGKRYFDIYVHDADSNGFHLRSQRLHTIANKTGVDGNGDPIYEMNPLLAPVTNMTNLDLNDWMNIYFGSDLDGNIIQLTDQQFVNLYFYRYDWFTDTDIKNVFNDTYGYTLGVPRTWKSYEDIAGMFRNRCRFLNSDDLVPKCIRPNDTPPVGWDGARSVYGHADYGAMSTLQVLDGKLGWKYLTSFYGGPAAMSWRYTDAWFSMAGSDDKGLPNGGANETGVDDWGIKVVNHVPIGASVERGGAMNSYAAEYGLNRSIEWMFNYAPSAALDWDFLTAGSKPSRGDIAQMIFEYTPDLAKDYYKSISSPVVNSNGELRWRVAPSPVGRYWDRGMKVGYQDSGAWSIPKTTKGKQLEAAWLWAQFCVSKTVDLKRFIVAGTPIRKSTINANYVSDRIKFWGGLVEFYRSPLRHLWTDTGTNVPHYPALAQVWAPNLAKAMVWANGTEEGRAVGYTPRQAVDGIAHDMDILMQRMRFNLKSPNLAPVNTDQSTYYTHAPDVSPKAERTEAYDVKWTMELNVTESYQAFFDRYMLCMAPGDAACSA
ncbi:hypothetical protein SpCBS45565_g01801 [Spizellomyces sp. 'palustris']|nr:hypothetical protein SpCBS45565_g01801 [Spizellomyces sp. 'palustris']